MLTVITAEFQKQPSPTEREYVIPEKSEDLQEPISHYITLEKL